MKKFLFLILFFLSSVAFSQTYDTIDSTYYQQPITYNYYIDLTPSYDWSFSAYYWNTWYSQSFWYNPYPYYWYTPYYWYIPYWNYGYNYGWHHHNWNHGYYYGRRYNTPPPHGVSPRNERYKYQRPQQSQPRYERIKPKYERVAPSYQRSNNARSYSPPYYRQPKSRDEYIRPRVAPEQRSTREYTQPRQSYTQPRSQPPQRQNYSKPQRQAPPQRQMSQPIQRSSGGRR